MTGFSAETAPRAVVRGLTQLDRGQVWCVSCGNTQEVHVAIAMRHGWPKCCGQTMTIDSPEERAALRAPGEG